MLLLTCCSRRICHKRRPGPATCRYPAQQLGCCGGLALPEDFAPERQQAEWWVEGLPAVCVGCGGCAEWVCLAC